MMKFTKTLPFVLLLTLPLAGCSLGDKIAEKAVEKGLEKATGASNIDLDEDGGVNITTKDGTMSTGDNAELPSTWPSSVPTPKDATLKYAGSSTQGGAESWSAIYESSKTAATYKTTYTETFKDAGWTISNESSFNTEGKTYASFNAEKGGYKVSVVAVDGDDDKCALTLTVEKMGS